MRAITLAVSVAIFLHLLSDERFNVHGGKVLLVPTPVIESYWFEMAKIGQVLSDRGHDVAVVFPERVLTKRQKDRPDFQFETFQDQGTWARLEELNNLEREEAGEDGQIFLPRLLQLRQMWGQEMAKHCDLLLRNSTLTDRMKASRYDVIVTDALFHCGAIVGRHLDVPNVALVAPLEHDTRATGVPFPCSYVPSVFSTFDDRMPFLQRLENAFVVCKQMAVFWLWARAHDSVTHRYLGKGETALTAMSHTDVWLYVSDPLLDFPQPSMPNMVNIGGFHVKQPGSLSEELETFMRSSGDDGVVVVSFGAFMNSVPTQQAEVLATVFALLPQKVLWRHGGEKPASLGSNTKLMNWLPQNDLLGHEKTRLFVTHAGRSSVYEALHHGVPVVCLPTCLDQPANAARLVARGAGISLNYRTVTVEELYQAIVTVITDERYRAAAARLSSLHRDQPQPPMGRAVWWIEHVIKHGGLPHLRARAVELPWYQYYLLDVAAFLMAVCSVAMGVVWFSCLLCCRKCRRVGKIKSQ
ncbi:UDP-glucuronosyltransferase 1-2-like [Branchiostoma lanceolatum]|uniref:UDP-glucuronosyltransferase 1-2-like n=1 Tax=Branchiostoma lanceolatum TaxID=7740 RepID=UPI003452518B